MAWRPTVAEHAAKIKERNLIQNKKDWVENRIPRKAQLLGLKKSLLTRALHRTTVIEGENISPMPALFITC